MLNDASINWWVCSPLPGKGHVATHTWTATNEQSLRTGTGV